MSRRKTAIPKTLPLRSSAWTRFRWLASGVGFKSFAWTLSIAVISGAVWSQWAVIQPAAATGIRQAAVAILGEDVVGAPQSTPQVSIMEPATAKQRKELTEAIEGVAVQVADTGETLPEESHAVLYALIGDCEELILDPAIQSVSVLFCTQQIATETAALKEATANEIARIEEERLAAEEAAAEEARRVAQEEADRQRAENNKNNNSGNKKPPPAPAPPSQGGGGGGTRTVVVSCSKASNVTLGGVTKSVPGGGSASWSVSGGGAGFSADTPPGTCQMSLG